MQYLVVSYNDVDDNTSSFTDGSWMYSSSQYDIPSSDMKVLINHYY
jgi:hypothetical protein